MELCLAEEVHRAPERGHGYDRRPRLYRGPTTGQSGDRMLAVMVLKIWLPTTLDFWR